MQSSSVTAPNGQQYTVYVRDEADESVIAEIFKLREYRAAELIIKEAVSPIIDVGAHSGLFTLYARALNATVPLIAIEPEPNNLVLLKKHLAENRISGVTVIEGALAGTTGKRKLIVSPDSHNHHLLEKGENSIKEMVVVPGYDFAAVVKKLASKQISLIKMDIEGGEYEVLESFSPEHFKMVGASIMEYHTFRGHHYQEIEMRLRENGFGVQIFPSKFDRQMGFIFATNKRTYYE